MNINLIEQENIMAFARRLMKAQPFIERHCTLFMDVPVKCLQYGKPLFSQQKNLKTMPAEVGNTTMDFAICCNTQLLLGITLEIFPDESHPLLHTYLPDFPHLSYPAFQLAEQDTTNFWNEFYALVMHHLAQTDVCSDYLLPYIPQNFSPAELMPLKLLCSPTALSAYGADTGLFFQWNSHGEKQIVQRICTVPAYEDAFVQATKRLASVEAPDTAILNATLHTPLTDLFHMDGDDILSWERQLQDCQSAPCASPDAIPVHLETYQDLLDVLRKIQDSEAEFIMDGDPVRTAWVSVMQQAALLLNTHAKDFRNMPLESYFQACAQLQKNSYPLWVYQRVFADFLNPAALDKAPCTVGDMIWLLTAPDAVDEAEKYSREALLSALLFQPICK